MTRKYDRVCSARFSDSQANNTFAKMELGIGTGLIEIIRLEIGAANHATPLDEIQDIAIYLNDTSAVGGSAITERILNGAGSIHGNALNTFTASPSTPNYILQTAFPWVKGFVYHPWPDERPTLIGTTRDWFGYHFPGGNAGGGTITYQATLVWGEIG